MMFGPARFDLAGEELLRMIQEELAQANRPARPEDVAALLDLTPDQLWQWLDERDRSWLDEVVARWNAKADGHAMSRIVMVDHGDEVELFLGHPLRPRHPHHTMPVGPGAPPGGVANPVEPAVSSGARFPVTTMAAGGAQVVPAGAPGAGGTGVDGTEPPLPEGAPVEREPALAGAPTGGTMGKAGSGEGAT